MSADPYRALRSAGIVGVGESKLGRVPDTSPLELQRNAALAAVHDAGLELQDIDGLLTCPIRTTFWPMPCGTVAKGLGLSPRYLATIDTGGASGMSMLQHAVMAIATGACHTVLCVGGQNPLSHVSRDDAVRAMANLGWADTNYEAPYGPLIPTLYALVAQRHMHEYGTRPEQLAEVAVTIRHHASLNPWAHKREPITVGDVLSSREISSPLRMLDCAIVSDGAAAFIVQERSRALDRRRPPVTLLGHGGGFTHTTIGDHDNIATTGAVQSGRNAFSMAGLRPANVDCAQLYDCFTITVIIELEDLGFCAKGEGGAFVQGGRIGLGGALPTTTHGGLLSACHPGVAGGMFHINEAVRQLRGECGGRQVPDAEVALVHGNGGILGFHATALLGREWV